MRAEGFDWVGVGTATEGTYTWTYHDGLGNCGTSDELPYDASAAESDRGVQQALERAGYG